MPELSLLEKMRERNRSSEPKESMESLKKCERPKVDMKTESDFFNRMLQEGIQTLNDRNINMMDVPEVTRKRALELEGLVTEAANNGNQELFMDCLEKWQNCFH